MEAADARLDAARDALQARFPHREVWWLSETTFPGCGTRVTWHSRPQGAPAADVHGDSPEHLAEHIVMAEADAAAEAERGTVRYVTPEMAEKIRHEEEGRS